MALSFRVCKSVEFDSEICHAKCWISDLPKLHTRSRGSPWWLVLGGWGRVCRARGAPRSSERMNQPCSKAFAVSHDDCSEGYVL